MDDQTKIGFRIVDWSETTERHLMLIDGLEPCDITFYMEAVKAGRKGLLGVFVNDERAGSVVWCLSNEPKGRVFIIDEMAAQCRAGVDLVLATEKMARVFGANLDAKFMRFMTRRAGLIAKVKERFDVTYILEAPL